MACEKPSQLAKESYLPCSRPQAVRSVAREEPKQLAKESQLANRDLASYLAHKYECATCHASLPTSHLLSCHISELHDSYFAAQAARRMRVRAGAGLPRIGACRGRTGCDGCVMRQPAQSCAGCAGCGVYPAFRSRIGRQPPAPRLLQQAGWAAGIAHIAALHPPTYPSAAITHCRCIAAWWRGAAASSARPRSASST